MISPRPNHSRNALLVVALCLIAGKAWARPDDVSGDVCQPVHPPLREVSNWVTLMDPCVNQAAKGDVAAPPFPKPEDVHSIIDLQVFRTSEHAVSPNGTELELINLNPNVGAWYVLRIKLPNGAGFYEFHLEVPTINGTMKRHALNLNAAGVDINGVGRCSLWDTGNDPAQAKIAGELVPKSVAFGPLCGSNLYVRQAAAVKSDGILASASDKLRGTRFSWISDLAKSAPGMADKPEHVDADGAAVDRSRLGQNSADAPEAARVNPDRVKNQIPVKGTMLDVKLAGGKREVVPGEWYPTEANPGVSVSVIQPDMIDSSIMSSYSDRVKIDDKATTRSLGYLTSFDLDQVSLGYVVGANQPNQTWANPPAKINSDEEAYKKERADRNKLGGPDGVGNARPLHMNGLVPPYDVKNTISSFNAGYQRYDMVMVSGALAERNQSSHWGFVQNGVVLSKLQPGLATTVVYTDGTVDMLTWPEDDSKLRARVKDARQNSMALIEGYDQSKHQSIPGIAVAGAHIGDANWAATTPRLRSGVCLQESGGHRHLIFAYLPSAEPSTLARVFQAYDCKYAMQLDINLERVAHLPYYKHDANGGFKGTEFLNKAGENAVTGGKMEFVELNDARDFFYVMPKRN